MWGNAEVEAAEEIHEGRATEAYRLLGAHIEEGDGEYRYTFRILAPRAEEVHLACDRFGWDVGAPLARMEEGGIFELSFTAREDLRGMPYKLRITVGGRSFLKGDPYAFASRGADDGASLLLGLPSYPFTDSAYLAARRRTMTADGGALACPINIYEVHLGSFLREEGGRYASYATLADALLAYAKYMGYTHVELLPVAEYPFDGSWGYQVCGFYAPTVRFGSPRDFCALVDRLHAGGVGVILDWVAGHFPKDAWGLYELDGAPLYEHSIGWRREARGWGTRYFDLARPEVKSFLISNALYWLREFHIDGLRVDAVASMLYLDYDRREGEWEPAEDGSNRAADAAEFFRSLSAAVRREVPDALLIAEESTDYHGITHREEEGGLGFHLKWSMGFANDFFAYLSASQAERVKRHTALNFPITYAFRERYVLPISHDEVVHGKRSLLGKIAGTAAQKMATCRTALLFMMGFPGKKLLFMGTEFGVPTEWDYDGALDFSLLSDGGHDALREYVAALNRFYLSSPPLYELDFVEDGFSWLLPDEGERRLAAFLRRDKRGHTLVFAVSFSEEENRDVCLPMPEAGRYRCVFSSGAPIPSADTDENRALTLSLPPLSGVVLARAAEEISLFES